MAFYHGNCCILRLEEHHFYPFLKSRQLLMTNDKKNKDKTSQLGKTISIGYIIQFSLEQCDHTIIRFWMLPILVDRLHMRAMHNLKWNLSEFGVIYENNISIWSQEWLQLFQKRKCRVKWNLNSQVFLRITAQQGKRNQAI